MLVCISVKTVYSAIRSFGQVVYLYYNRETLFLQVKTVEVYVTTVTISVSEAMMIDIFGVSYIFLRSIDIEICTPFNYILQKST